MEKTPEDKKVMTPARVFAIIAIFICATVGWFVLAGSIVVRTETASTELRQKIRGLWGSELEQASPVLESIHKKEEKTKDAAGVEKTQVTESSRSALPLSSRVDADMEVEHRKKGLLWYNLYRIQFSGTYEFAPPETDASRADVRFDLPSTDVIYDGMVFLVNGKVENPVPDGQSLRIAIAPLHSGPVTLKVQYTTQGMDNWKYVFEKGKVSQVKDFFLTLHVRFDGFDFPDGTLSPVIKEKTAEGWTLRWEYASLLADPRLGIQVPQKLNPGPVASRITFFAPVSLLFFFFIVMMLSILRQIPLHPMHYFFLAAAYFSFHLLFAYLIDRVDLHLAFGLASAVLLFLVASYLRIVTGSRFAFVEAGVSQLLYLVLFSYAFFWEGYTGLSITVGAIITLFVIMQKTAKVRWEEKF